MTDICRQCWKSSIMQVDIFAERHMDEPSLAVMMSECYNCMVKHDDTLPKQLCLDCVLATKNAFQLKRDLDKLSTVNPKAAVKEWLFGNCGIDAAHINTTETNLENCTDAKNLTEIIRKEEQENHANILETKYYCNAESDFKEKTSYEMRTLMMRTYYDYMYG